MTKPSSIHGLGLFTTRTLEADSRVVQYIGRRVTKNESLALCESNNPFVFYLDAAFDLDGNISANLARFINHSCDPNCEARLIAGQIWLVALRGLAAGDELTFNYGYDLEDYSSYPCHCGAEGCLGFMVAAEFASSVLNQQQFKSTEAP